MTLEQPRQDILKVEKIYSNRKNDVGIFDGLDRLTRKKIRDKERQEEEWVTIIQKMQSANPTTYCGMRGNTMTTVLYFCCQSSEYTLIDSRNCQVYYAKRFKDIMGSENNEHHSYSNRIQMLQGMQDRRLKIKIKESIEYRESRNKEETPRIIEKAEIKTETIHDIIERQQEKKEKHVLLQNVMMEIRRAMMEKLDEEIPENRIDMYIAYAHAGLKRRKEKDKEKEERGFMELKKNMVESLDTRNMLGRL